MSGLEKSDIRSKVERIQRLKGNIWEQKALKLKSGRGLRLITQGTKH